jgi:hypothetical protein
MSESFWGSFGAANVEDIPEDPYTIPDNRYKVMVSKVDTTDFNKPGGPKYFTLEVTVLEGENKNKTANTMIRLSPETAADSPDYASHNARNVSNAKRLLLSLGVPAQALGQFDIRKPDHRAKLMGIRGTARCFPAKKAGYNNFSDFVTNSAEAASGDVPAEAFSGVAPAVEEVSIDAISALDGF